MTKIPMPTPGEILLEEFLKPYGISRNKLATDIRVPANRISAIISGKRERSNLHRNLISRPGSLPGPVFLCVSSFRE